MEETKMNDENNVNVNDKTKEEFIEIELIINKDNKIGECGSIGGWYGPCPSPNGPCPGKPCVL